MSKVRAGKVNWYSGRKRTDRVGLWECLIVSRGGGVGREWGSQRAEEDEDAPIVSAAASFLNAP